MDELIFSNNFDGLSIDKDGIFGGVEKDWRGFIARELEKWKNNLSGQFGDELSELRKQVAENKNQIKTLNEYNEELKNKIGELKEQLVPIGTIITWSLTTNPDRGTWLECNGQSCVDYPKLKKVLGQEYVPDYRGLFLRGLGSVTTINSKYGNVTHTSSNLGVIQEDAIRNITGQTGGYEGLRNNNGTIGSCVDSGCFKQGSTNIVNGYCENDTFDTDIHLFDASYVVPTADENRPVNTAVRYMIKADDQYLIHGRRTVDAGRTVVEEPYIEFEDDALNDTFQYTFD